MDGEARAKVGVGGTRIGLAPVIQALEFLQERLQRLDVLRRGGLEEILGRCEGQPHVQEPGVDAGQGVGQRHRRIVRDVDHPNSGRQLAA